MLTNVPGWIRVNDALERPKESKDPRLAPPIPAT